MYVKKDLYDWIIEEKGRDPKAFVNDLIKKARKESEENVGSD